MAANWKEFTACVSCQALKSSTHRGLRGQLRMSQASCCPDQRWTCGPISPSFAACKTVGIARALLPCTPRRRHFAGSLVMSKPPDLSAEALGCQPPGGDEQVDMIVACSAASGRKVEHQQGGKATLLCKVVECKMAARVGARPSLPPCWARHPRLSQPFRRQRPGRARRERKSRRREGRWDLVLRGDTGARK